ncbi:MAG TPA: MBOAT family protein [Steroidobacteraceae bacterium]|nr:MBOAT family protein [Steroidobacteraceae bacterium]
MYFDSTVYIVFLALVVLVYWRLRLRAQNLFLLGASYFFYGWWDWRFLLLMGASTVVDFLVARGLEDSPNPARRRMLLTLSLVVNFGFLGFFKYFNFFVDSFAELALYVGLKNVPHTLWSIVLPPAISFYTFQEVAYIVDVYHGKVRAARSLVDYALFVSLFPHLIAGPIQRPSHLLPQVQQSRTWDANKAFDGLLLILEGLFRKVVVADNCALIANAAFSGNFGAPNLATVALGTYAFAWQIYGDFSGYSSIARGSAQLLGFHFMVNFRQPYLAQSLQDFWRRWHISLSSWLRDYLYIPLGGNRKGRVRTYLNLMTTMLLGGLWHGANWTFVIWGGIHGGGLAVERLIAGEREVSDARNKLAGWLRRIFIFNVVCVAWIFFREPSLHGALAQLVALGSWQWQPVYGVALVFLTVIAGLLLALDLQLEAKGTEYLFADRSLHVRVAIGLLFCVLITLMGANQANAFIYFRF